MAGMYGWRVVYNIDWHEVRILHFVTEARVEEALRLCGRRA